MILELVGLPGSGKSTFARALEKEGRWSRARINSRGELLYFATLFLLRHPISALRQLGWLVQYRGDRSLWYTKFVNLFLVHNAKYMKASGYPRAIVDQGHLQNIMSLFDIQVSPAVIERYLAMLPRSDIVLFFDIDEEERKSRLAKRGHGTREGVQEDVRIPWQAASEQHFGVLFGLRSRCSWTSLVLTAGQEEALMRELAQLRLWRFVMHLRMPTEKAHGLQIAKTLEALTKIGEHVELWVPRRTNPIREDVFTYYSLTTSFPLRTISVFEALRFVNTLGSLAYWLDALAFMLGLFFERIDTEVIYYTRSAPVAWLLKEKGARVYFEAHLWPGSKERVFRFFLAGIEHIIANSDGTRRAFQTRGFTNVTVIRNGADLEKFEIDMSHLDARKLVGLPIEGNIIMYVGSFGRWKGVVTLYGAWTKMQKQFPDTTLVLVGGEIGTLEQFPECQHIGIDASVIVLPHNASSLIPFFLRSANILVLPNEGISDESIHYTSPIKLFEYMASGRPIVASSLPAMREVLDDTVATLFAPGDSADLAEKLSYALMHTVEGEDMARRASELANDFSWEKRAERIRAIVTEKDEKD